MNTFYIFLSLLLACCLNVDAYAGWSDFTTVTSLDIHSGPKRSFLHGIEVTDAGCSFTVPVILLDPSTPQANDSGKEMYATVLAAAMAGKQVRVYAGNCWSAYNTPIVVSVEVIP